MKFLAVPVLVVMHSAAFALELEPLWVSEAHMVMEGAPMVVDLDRDGGAELITAAFESMIAFDGTGKELWRFDTAGRYQTCPAVLERDGATPLIFAGDNTGLFTCLDGTGAVVWQAELAPIFSSSPALADLNGDGRVEVIVGDKSARVRVLDALSGDALWERKLSGDCGSPAVGDLSGGTGLETVVMTGAGTIHALDSAGEVLWEFAAGEATPDWAMSAPILFEDAEGNKRIACGAAPGRLVCLNAEGALEWELATKGDIAATLSAGDLDGDGEPEVLGVTQLGMVYRLDAAGQLLWEIDTQGRSLAPGAIVDIDGDQHLDYVLFTQNGILVVFNGNGELIYTRQFEHRTINMTAAFGDIVPEREGLELAVTGGESGRMYCLGAPVPVDAPAAWRTYRGNNQLSGSVSAHAPGKGRDELASTKLPAQRQTNQIMRPLNLAQDEILSNAPVIFEIQMESVEDGASKGIVTAAAACIRPDGTRQGALGKVAGGAGILHLPLDLTREGVYHFSWSLRDSKGATLESGTRDLTLFPLKNELDLLRRAVHELQGISENADIPTPLKELMIRQGMELLAGAQGLLEDQTEALKAQFEHLQLKVANSSGEVFPETGDLEAAELADRARRLLALSDLVRKAPEAGLVAFSGSTWENRAVNLQLPQAIHSPLKIAQRCVPGEHQPVAVKLLNLSGSAMTVSHDVIVEEGPEPVVFSVEPVPTNQGLTAWDPMLPLANHTIAIPPLEAREVWLDFDLAATAPGRYRSTVMFRAGALESGVEVALEVLPFEMAGFDEMRLCAWAEYKANAVEDLLAHGNTVFIGDLPPVKDPGAADAAVQVDAAPLLAFLEPLRGHDVFLLFEGIPDLGVPMESENYVSRFRSYMNEVRRIIAEAGFDPQQVALYPYDEPATHGWDTVNQYLAFARQALKARPDLKFYVNGTGDLPKFKALAEVAGIWSPSFYALPEDTPEMRVVRESGKTLWSYDCFYHFARPIGPNTKTINIVAEYRLAALAGFNFGATGIGFWSYNHGPAMWEADEFEYPLVYTNPDGSFTTSRRWEAVREGIEDARISIALRQRMNDPSMDAAIKAQISGALALVNEVTSKALQEAELGLARYVLDHSNNDETVARVRAALLDCVALLAG